MSLYVVALWWWLVAAVKQQYFTVLKHESSMVTTRTWLGITSLSFDRHNADPNFHGCGLYTN